MKNIYLKIDLKEELLNIFLVSILILAIGKVFYGSFLGGIVLSPGIFFVMKQRNRVIRQRKMDELEGQFRDMLLSLSDIMRVGYSMENALKEAHRDMAREHGKESMICKELAIINRRVEMNMNLVDVLNEFYKRCEIEYIKDLIKVFTVAKRTGGNLIEAVGNVAGNISMKEEVKEEIMVEIRAKTLEQKIMCFIPFLVTAYISTTSSNTMSIMYSTMIGRLVMTVCLVLYLLAYIWSEKVARIEV